MFLNKLLTKKIVISKTSNNSKLTSIGIESFLKNKKNIFDIGTGPNGSSWWKEIDQDASITGIDNWFFTKKIPKNTKIYKLDATKLNTINDGAKLPLLNKFGNFINDEINWKNRFDMVVANHVLEHVEFPEKVIWGIDMLLKKKGIVYIGFPESTNFTDIFYHLIHSEGGGHIQKLTKDQVLKLFYKRGFKLLSCRIWPDDWGWFEKLYDFKKRGITMINNKEISYLANVFRKELTPKKGYFYGWEMVFQKND